MANYYYCHYSGFFTTKACSLFQSVKRDYILIPRLKCKCFFPNLFLTFTHLAPNPTCFWDGLWSMQHVADIHPPRYITHTTWAFQRPPPLPNFNLGKPMLIHYQADDTVRMRRWELNYENLKKRLPKIRKKRMCNGILLIRLNTIVLGSQIL